MGNACCKGKISDDDDSDRAQIISNNNHNNNYDIPRSNNGHEEDIEYYINLNGASQTGDEIPYGSFSCGNKTQEQAALDRIYHRLAMNVIDVAPGEAMIIQPAEVCERQKEYQSRLHQLEGLLTLSLLTKTGGTKSIEQDLHHLHHSHHHHHHSFNKTHKLVSRLSKMASVNDQHQQPLGTVDNNFFSSSSSSSNNYTNDIDRQKLYQIPDRRRVEYDAIPQDEEELIKEYSLRSMKAVKSLAPTINEPVITQFNL